MVSETGRIGGQHGEDLFPEGKGVFPFVGLVVSGCLNKAKDYNNNTSGNGGKPFLNQEKTDHVYFF